MERLENDDVFLWSIWVQTRPVGDGGNHHYHYRGGDVNATVCYVGLHLFVYYDVGRHHPVHRG